MRPELVCFVLKTVEGTRPPTPHAERKAFLRLEAALPFTSFTENWKNWALQMCRVVSGKNVRVRLYVSPCTRSCMLECVCVCEGGRDRKQRGGTNDLQTYQIQCPELPLLVERG